MIAALLAELRRKEREIGWPFEILDRELNRGSQRHDANPAIDRVQMNRRSAFA
jgi:hypothetical protein